MGDMGVHATDEILTNLKRAGEEQRDPRECKLPELLIDSIKEQMTGRMRRL